LIVADSSNTSYTVSSSCACPRPSPWWHCLGVQVNHQHPLPDLGQARGQIDRGGGFANSALLVGNTEYFGHGNLEMVQPLASVSRETGDNASLMPKPIRNTRQIFAALG
jgi:hypothetical protein